MGRLWDGLARLVGREGGGSEGRGAVGSEREEGRAGVGRWTLEAALRS